MYPIHSIDDEIKNMIPSTLHQFYRIVDLQTHDVYDYHNQELIPLDKKCFSIWEQEDPCTNCTSCRALLNGKRIVKLGYQENIIYLIDSLPINIKGKPYALELIQDVSDSFMLNTDITSDTNDICSVVSAFNDLVMKDTFTLLYNKQYLNERLPVFIQKAQESHYPLSLALMDIDLFKNVNDTFGHLFGDKVILAFAQQLKQLMNHDTFCARIGGDEFMIIFENRSEQESEQICEQLMCSLSDIRFEEHPDYHLAISYGISTLQENDSIDNFINRADERMYEMKKNHHILSR